VHCTSREQWSFWFYKLPVHHLFTLKLINLLLAKLHMHRPFHLPTACPFGTFGLFACFITTQLWSILSTAWSILDTYQIGSWIPNHLKVSGFHYRLRTFRVLSFLPLLLLPNYFPSLFLLSLLSLFFSPSFFPHFILASVIYFLPVFLHFPF
jgi:hypothetical protein